MAAEVPKRSGSPGAAPRGSLDDRVWGCTAVRRAVPTLRLPGAATPHPRSSRTQTGRPPLGFCFPRPKSGHATNWGALGVPPPPGQVEAHDIQEATPHLSTARTPGPVGGALAVTSRGPAPASRRVFKASLLALARTSEAGRQTRE